MTTIIYSEFQAITKIRSTVFTHLSQWRDWLLGLSANMYNWWLSLLYYSVNIWYRKKKKKKLTFLMNKTTPTEEEKEKLHVGNGDVGFFGFIKKMEECSWVWALACGFKENISLTWRNVRITKKPDMLK